MFLADCKFVCKRVNRCVKVRVAKMQKSVACICRVLGELLGSEVFELFLDFGDCLAASCCRECRELIQDALQKAEVPVLGRCAGASLPETCVALGCVGDFIELDCLRCEFCAASRCGGDCFDRFAEEVLCEELVECIVDFFFARNFKRGALLALSSLIVAIFLPWLFYKYTLFLATPLSNWTENHFSSIIS